MSLLNTSPLFSKFCVALVTNARFKNAKKLYSTQEKHLSKVKVTLCGAAGSVGQHLALLLKQSPLIEELALYDKVSICGFGAELGHIDTKCRVSAYASTDNIKDALEGAKVVVVVAASPKTSSLSYKAMFDANAKIIKEIVENYVDYSPRALLAITTSPVNSLVPLASEVIKANGTYNPNIVFGVTTLDVVRTNAFVADVLGLEPECVSVPVIGGNSDKTIVPILSKAKPCNDFVNKELERITRKVKNARSEIIKAKSKEGATLASAFATARFVISLVKAIRGQPNIVECAYVRSKAHCNAKYLSTPLLLGPKGIQKNLGVPDRITEYEHCQLEKAVKHLRKDIKRGERFLGIEDPPICDPCDPNPKAAPCPIDICKLEKEQQAQLN